MRVSVVGLGPGPVDWVTPAAVARLTLPKARVFVRTRFFPGLNALLRDVAWSSFDEVYDSAATLAEVHTEIASRLLACSCEEVVLAVPGDGVLGEALLGRLRDEGASVEVIPGVPVAAGALSAS